MYELVAMNKRNNIVRNVYGRDEHLEMLTFFKFFFFNLSFHYVSVLFRRFYRQNIQTTPITHDARIEFYKLHLSFINSSFFFVSELPSNDITVSAT